MKKNVEKRRDLARGSIGAFQARLAALLEHPQSADAQAIRDAVARAAEEAGFSQPPRYRAALELRHDGAWASAVRLEVEI